MGELMPGRDDWLRSGGEDLRHLRTPGRGMECGQLFVPNGTVLKAGHVWTDREGKLVANCTLPEAPYVRISRVPIRWLEPILDAAAPDTDEGGGG